MPNNIRIGIVGATVTPGGSGWGANAHVPAINALPDFELKAVCTAHEDTAKASQAAFGSELAFHDINDMVAHPEIDLVAVSVRVPWHRELVMPALQAGKDVFCEWPLGANLAEAEEMANLAREKGVRTLVGLQARSDPAMMQARELIAQGYVGDILTANLTVVGQAIIDRGPGRIWQGVRANGANTLTISGGHAIDALCYLVGEFTEVSARVSTMITQWRHEGSGEPFDVDSPDNIIVAGRLQNGADASIHVSSVPSNPSGARYEIYGREGTIVIRPGGSANIGPNKLYAARGGAALEEYAIEDRFNLVPEGTPGGPPRNVAQAYVRMADSLAKGQAFDPDFDLAVTRHRLIDAIERSSAEGRSISL